MAVLTTSRSKLIDSFINEGGGKINEFMKIFYEGDVHTHEVYKIPIKYLIYNIRNGRFRAELLEKEDELKRKLDATNKEDAQVIQQLLLDQDENETELLKQDLIKHGQIDPGIITSDGAVINANRRMAILSYLFKETREEKYSYLKVGILPQRISTSDLWRIEAGLQFGKDFRLKYGGVNELLKLKEGLKQGLSEKDISVALLGRYSEKQVKEKINILKLIDSYLVFIEKPGEYHLIHEEGALEKFISGSKAMERLSFGKERAMEKIDMYNLLFLLIEKTNARHLDLRELDKIANNVNAYKELKKGYNSSAPRKIDKQQLNENFETALEISNAQKDKDKPILLLKKALSNIQNVNQRSGVLKEEEGKDLLNQLKNSIQNLIEASKK